MENGNETDTDCGGRDCPRSEAGFGCNEAGDCLSNVCGANRRCPPAACNDRVRNGAETDTDCGGSCPACLDGQGCGRAEDCQSRVCTGNLYRQGSCSDIVRNGEETDVDCGGPSCAKCGDGKRCTAAVQCEMHPRGRRRVGCRRAGCLPR